MAGESERDWGQELQEVSYAPGEFLFLEGERTFHFFVLIEGEVEVFKTDSEGKIFPLASVGPGASLGEFAMIDRQARSASARAKTRVRATRISEAAYEHLLSELPEWAMSVMRALVERLRTTNDIIRRHKIADKAVIQQVGAIEFDTETTLIDESPFLRAADDDETGAG